MASKPKRWYRYPQKFRAYGELRAEYLKNSERLARISWRPDKVPDRTLKPFTKLILPFFESFLKKHGFNSRSVIVELGSGQGDLAGQLTKKGYRIITADIIPKTAKVVANIERLPFRTASVDFLYSNFCVEYTVMDKTVAEIRRVLKPGAGALITFHHPDNIERAFRREKGRMRLVRAIGILDKKGQRQYLEKNFPQQFIGENLFESAEEMCEYFRKSGFKVIDSSPIAVTPKGEKKTINLAYQIYIEKPEK